jgi:hypothetical protein
VGKEEAAATKQRHCKHVSAVTIQHVTIDELLEAVFSAKSVKVILWPTASQLVCLGVKPHLGPKSRFLLLSDSFVFVDVRRPL